jgi:arginine decarboxylase
MRLHLAHPPGPDAVADALRRHPDAKGMLLITPTDYGGCAAIRETAEICHTQNRPLIVDEAWGAHLPFHPDLPAWAMDAGADLCVNSVHKMGAGLEQGSVSTCEATGSTPPCSPPGPTCWAPPARRR